MRVKFIEIRNFRRLENVRIEFEKKQTIFVGPNNSGKTSATAIMRNFLNGEDFSIYDFSASSISKFDNFPRNENACQLPTIELDIWFEVNPKNIEYGQAILLIPSLSEEFKELGVRLKLCFKQPEKLITEFLNKYPNGTSKESTDLLSKYLENKDVFTRNTTVDYYALDPIQQGETVESRINPSDCRKLLDGLLRVDFVDAQRNIDDQESSKSNRLSSSFAKYYRNNLEQAKNEKDANKIIDKNNESLTHHYSQQFGDLFEVIRNLGVPSINDRELRIVSTLNPDTALRGSTDLFYIDQGRQHELPEKYNGLGFKNLIYIAIQIKYLHTQWARTSENRPLCQIIFIEEPEVHLHAQVQQTFINNIMDILDTAANQEKPSVVTPQLVISTHSSHLLDTVDFAKVRYFKKTRSGDTEEKPSVMNASDVLSLREFNPQQLDSISLTNNREGLYFLKQYLRLNHCDLFFADAAILVEGATEKLLLPKMIELTNSKLKTKFITILEIGGAFAHRFDDLFSFLSIPYLVITDLDSVLNKKVCRADEPGAVTSNGTIKALTNKNKIEDLKTLTLDQRVSENHCRCITFQRNVKVKKGNSEKNMLPRSFEESFIYENFELLCDDKLELKIEQNDSLDVMYRKIFNHTCSGTFKKTDFAMHILNLGENHQWNVPRYIECGLNWLDNILNSSHSNN